MKYILLIFLGIILLTSCTVRHYEVFIFCSDNSKVVFRADVLAEVPHTTSIDGKLDLPDASILGK
jgi:hypothetical protein